MARIQSITTRTAVVAGIATVGFGGLAALTYSGTSNATAAAATTTQAIDGAGTDSTTSTDTTRSATDSVTPALQAAPVPTATTRKARVTSGGSGH
ncbi:MAG TPA: hypothetical protein VE011_10855 [Candidatus Dormibacteraeota bacterium]|nr:hypothetical protein [Candidatus Dormibacteraeota bacterium]